MKKKIFYVVTLLLGVLVLSSFTINDKMNEKKNDCKLAPSVTAIDSQSNVVFRGKQEFKNDKTGVEIYCYPSSKCEWWDGDRLALTCTYTISDDEIRFLDEEGETVYKGRIYWNTTHMKPLALYIQGGEYRNKH